MRMSHPITVLLFLATACATSGGGDDTPRDTSGLAPVDPAGATAAPHLEAPHALTGGWRLARADPQPGSGPGIRLELMIDSVRAGAVYGRVTRIISGNMGIDAGRYGPLTGAVRRDTLEMQTPAAEDGGRIGFAGRVVGDTIRLWRFEFGPDDLAATGREWLLTRTD